MSSVTLLLSVCSFSRGDTITTSGCTCQTSLDWVVLGGVDGIICVYDRATGELVHQLEHQVGGHVQVVEVSGHWTGKQLVAHKASDA